MRTLKTFAVMFKMEFKLSFREFSTIFFGILFPIALALFMCFLAKGDDYKTTLAFSSVLVIGVCATGLMSIPLTLSNYRYEKILKRYHVTPVSPGLLFLTQIVLNAFFALIASIGVWAVFKLVLGYSFTGQLLHFLGIYILILMTMYALGICIASVAPNIKTANYVCTLLYFPMLFLSGATVPYELFPRPLQVVSNVLPLTQGIKLIKVSALGGSYEYSLYAILYLVLLSIICITLSIKYFRWE